MDELNPDKFLIIIDGPVATGKSTLIKNMTADLGPSFVFEGGDLFRAVAVQLLKAGISPLDAGFADQIIHTARTVDFFRISGRELYETKVDELLPDILAIPRMRDTYVERFPGIVAQAPTDIVIASSRCAGHFHEARVKLYLYAGEEVCADRRARQKQKGGEDYDQVFQETLRRYRSEKQIWGYRFDPVPDAIFIDTESNDAQNVFAQVMYQVQPKLNDWRGQRNLSASRTPLPAGS